MDEEDVLLRKGLPADIALEGPVGVEVLLHRVVELGLGRRSYFSLFRQLLLLLT